MSHTALVIVGNAVPFGPLSSAPPLIVAVNRVDPLLFLNDTVLPDVLALAGKLFVITAFCTGLVLLVDNAESTVTPPPPPPDCAASLIAATRLFFAVVVRLDRFPMLLSFV